jgi:hypothetical protein
MDGRIPIQGPRPGQSRYRLAQNGTRFRVEHWRRVWLIGPYRWLPHRLSWRGKAKEWPCEHLHLAQKWLDYLRSFESPSGGWQPVEDR